MCFFLKNIPADDDSSDWKEDISSFCGTYGATNANDAAYARVIAKPQAMKTIFPVPVSFSRDTVAIGAEATAVYEASACDITPIFICNPFEPIGNTSARPSPSRRTAISTPISRTAASTASRSNCTTTAAIRRARQFRLPEYFGNGANVLSERPGDGLSGCLLQAERRWNRRPAPRRDRSPQD